MAGIALLGCGKWGRLILRDLVGLGARVHVIAPTAETRQFAIGAGAASAHADCSTLPETPDGFVVATPTNLHAESIESVLGFDRPIFVEKALAPSVTDARRLVDIAADRIFVMDKWRYHPGVEMLRDQARSGALGRILAIRSWRLGWGCSHTDVDPVWILLPHDLAIAYEILGALPAASAAFTSVPGHPGSGLIAILADGDGQPRIVAELSTNSPANRRAVHVIGTEGVATLDGSYADHIVVGKSGVGQGANDPERIPISGAMPLERELSAFLGYLSGGPPPRSSAAEGLLVVERIAALRRLAGLPE